MHNRPLVKARSSLGLPSSRVKSTDITKARTFLLSLDLLRGLLCLVLFWVAGDGTVHYRRRVQERFYFDCLTINAKDPQIFPLIQEAFESHDGLQGYCRIITTGKGISRLFLQHHGRLDEPILDALDTIPLAMLHPKLKILQCFLLAENTMIGYAYNSSREIFHQYLHNKFEGKHLLVLAQ